VWFSLKSTRELLAEREGFYLRHFHIRMSTNHLYQSIQYSCWFQAVSTPSFVGCRIHPITPSNEQNGTHGTHHLLEENKGFFGFCPCFTEDCGYITDSRRVNLVSKS